MQPEKDFTGATIKKQQKFIPAKPSLPEIFPDLFLVHARTPDAGYCFLIRRRQGNILTGNFNRTLVEERLEQIDSLGGVAAILVTGKHSAKAPNFPNALTDRYRPKIYISGIDAKTYREPLPGISAMKFERQWIADDIEAIRFPGYSKGGMAYLWKNRGRKFLFAGITITRIDGRWRTYVSSAVTSSAFKAALAELKATAGDVLVLSSFANTKDPWFAFSRKQWDGFFDALIAGERNAFINPVASDAVTIRTENGVN